MKIAIVVEKYNPLRGGAERSSMEMAAALSRCGVSVTIVAGKVVKNKELETPEKVEIVDLKVNGSRPVWFSLFDQAAGKYFSENKFDIIHSITPISGIDVYQPRAGSQKHALRRHIEQYSGIKKLYKRATAGFNRARSLRIDAEAKLATNPNGPVITVLSNYVADQFINDYGVSRDKLVLVRNAVNVDRFKSKELEEAAANLRGKFDPEDKLAIFLHVSEDPARKGLKELIKAVAAAKRMKTNSDRDIRLIVVGSFDYSKYYAEMRRYNLESSVVFFGPSREIPALMKMADVLVLPTWDDACSRVVMEALAAGTPAISTAFNGASELFSCGRFGLEIDSPANIEALAKSLNKLAGKKACSEMAEAILNSNLVESLSMDRHAAELIAMYNKIVSSM